MFLSLKTSSSSTDWLQTSENCFTVDEKAAIAACAFRESLIRWDICLVVVQVLQAVERQPEAAELLRSILRIGKTNEFLFQLQRRGIDTKRLIPFLTSTTTVVIETSSSVSAACTVHECWHCEWWSY